MQRIHQIGLLKIHSEYRTPMRRMCIFLLFLAFVQILSWLLPAWPNSKGIPYYTPLHDLLETISIVISMMVFAVGWNARDKTQSGNIILLSCVLFSVGILDFCHTASYVGMPDFFSPNDSQKHLNYWLTARFLGAFVLLVVAIREWKPLAFWGSRFIMLSFFSIPVSYTHLTLPTIYSV